MKNQFMNMMQWQAKGPQHHHHHHHQDHDQELSYGSDNNEYELVKNGRPYGTIVFSCNDSGSFKSEEEQMMMMQNPGRIMNAATHHHHHLHHNSPRMQNHHHAYTSYEDPHQFPRRQFLNSPTAAVVDDDINDEAEEFIQMEHKKLNFLMNNNKTKRTWSSS